MNRLIVLLLTATLFLGCKTVKVNKETQFATTQTMLLGSVGEQKTGVLNRDYNHTALPKYIEPVRVQANVVAFNSKSFKAFNNAKQSQNSSVNINYIDSVKVNQPTFLKVDILDRVKVLTSLNDNVNTEVFEFLKNSDNAHLVTSVSIALNKDQINSIINVDEVFLETSGIKNYVLKIYKKGSLQETIQFADGIVFAYQTSNACWKENSKYQLKIIDLAEADNKCPAKSYQSAKRAKKKINYYNF